MMCSYATERSGLTVHGQAYAWQWIGIAGSSTTATVSLTRACHHHHACATIAVPCSEPSWMSIVHSDATPAPSECPVSTSEKPSFSWSNCCTLTAISFHNNRAECSMPRCAFPPCCGERE